MIVHASSTDCATVNDDIEAASQDEQDVIVASSLLDQYLAWPRTNWLTPTP
jgi:hypothetical protein